jgi:hypothetical protein
VGVAAAPGPPCWGWPPRRGGKQAAGRPVLGPPRADLAEGGRLHRPEPHPRSAMRGSGGMREEEAAQSRPNPSASSRGEGGGMREMGAAA